MNKDDDLVCVDGDDGVDNQPLVIMNVYKKRFLDENIVDNFLKRIYDNVTSTDNRKYIQRLLWESISSNDDEEKNHIVDMDNDLIMCKNGGEGIVFLLNENVQINDLNGL